MKLANYKELGFTNKDFDDLKFVIAFLNSRILVNMDFKQALKFLNNH